MPFVENVQSFQKTYRGTEPVVAKFPGRTTPPKLADMSLYIVSYDLEHPQEFGEYEYFHAELRKTRAQKVLQDAWILRSALKADAIRDWLAKFVHRDDRVLVAEISERNWAAWKALGEIREV